MGARLTYMRLELKRAWKRFPQMAAGAIALMILMGAVALLAGRILYGESAVGRITVGVVLPDEDSLSKRAVSMLSSLESVKSLCDFTYLDQEEAEEKLRSGELYAVMKVPEDFVKDIVNGANTPVTVILPKSAGAESRIFKELADAGAGTLSAAQAGIYAGDELLSLYDRADSVSRLEEDLNRIYLYYSLPRMDYFRQIRVSATGDVDTAAFYGISMAALSLLLCAVPVSAYLAPEKNVMKQKLMLLGVGRGTIVASKILGMGSLMAAVGFLTAAAAVLRGWLEWKIMMLPALGLSFLAAAAFVVFVYEAAGSLLGGVMLLFILSIAMHFASGGFLPSVFLPAVFRKVAAVLPSRILMEGIQMAVTARWSFLTAGKLCLLTAAGFLAAVAAEAGRK